MSPLRFTKGEMIANAFVNALDDGSFRGLVSLSYRDGDLSNSRVYRADPPLESESEALEQASALAQHLLKRYEN